MRQTKKTKLSHHIAAAVTVGAMLGNATSASATGGAVVDAGSLVSNLITASAGFTQLLNVLGYVGGSGLAVAGIFKLKQHVDNPGQTPMKDGVMRLASGGALLSLPFMTQVMQGSVGEGQSSTGATIAKVSNFN